MTNKNLLTNTKPELEVKIVVASRGRNTGIMIFDRERCKFVDRPTLLPYLSFDGTDIKEVETKPQQFGRISILKASIWALEKHFNTTYDEEAGVYSRDADTKYAITNFFTTTPLEQNFNGGAFKYWIQTGKTLEGKEVETDELLLWDRFTKLFLTFFDVLNVRSVRSLSLHTDKNGKFHAGTSKESQYLHRGMKLLWDAIPKDEFSKEEQEANDDTMFA